MIWRARELEYAYPDAERDAVAGVSLQLPEGGCTALLGPNGSGKSTLLRLLLGTLAPRQGEVLFRDRPVSKWAPEALAREIGVVTQSEEIAFPLSVRELVAMGRYPYLGAWRRERDEDRRAIDAALRRCDVFDLRDRLVQSLSGGERQRARLARALAQEPRVLVLDEPTIALDIRHEMEIFELLHSLGRSGATVVVVTHNINLAARYADRLVVLAAGAVAAEGLPAEVLRRELLERVYGWPVQVNRHPGPGPDAGAPQVTPLAGAARVER